MRFCLPVVLALVLSTTGATRAIAQGRFDDSFTQGSYIRLSGTSVSPINPGGSLRDWKRGQGINLMYENWLGGSTGGPTRVGFGLFADYSLLPFDDAAFLAEGTTFPTGMATSASAKKAQIFQIGVNTRIRIPAPYIMPSIGISFGFLDWRPGKIQYRTSPTTGGTAKQQNRSGGALTLLGGLDKHIYDRWAIFGEASYTYAYTSFGEGLAASGSSCVASNCDLLKNTQLGALRGGVRVRIGR